LVGRLSGENKYLKGDQEIQVKGVEQETAPQGAPPTLAPPGDLVREFESFIEWDTEVCKEDGKPIVYLFSTTTCPHCTWIKDTFGQWAKSNADKIVVYYWELDIERAEVPVEHMAVYQKFNPNGTVPTFVFGCRYSRVGNGYEQEDDLEKEVESYNKVVQELI
jgi:thiol-disulfide isomerase/thioredoxin